MIILGVVGLFVICAGFGVLWGFIRGAKKSLVRLITFVCVALLAFFLTKPITEAVFRNVAVYEGKTFEVIIREVLEDSEIGGIFHEGGYLGDLITNLPVMIGSIVVFLVLFLLLKYLSLIVYAIIMAFIKKDAEKKKGMGMIYGAVSGLLLFFMLMIPISGLIDAVQVVSKYEIDNNTIFSDDFNDQIDNYQNSFVSSFGKMFGAGTAGFNYLTTQKIGAKDRSIIDVLDDLGSVVKLIDTFTKLMDADFEDMDHMIDLMHEVLYDLENLPEDLLDDLANALSSQLDVSFSINFSEIGFAEMHGALDDIQDILSIINQEELDEDDINTLIKTLSESPVLDILVDLGMTIPTTTVNSEEIEIVIDGIIDDPIVAGKLKQLFGIAP
ncbi:MAG: hypothetical protein FWG51_02820 [Firmicutes bacterium]|nr:hypothetical protein [Bacillota bacterium]